MLATYQKTQEKSKQYSAYFSYVIQWNLYVLAMEIIFYCKISYPTLSTLDIE